MGQQRQGPRHVLAAHQDALGNLERDRREVPDGQDPRPDEGVADALRGGGGGGNDADADAYGEKLQQIAAEYRSFADEPQSFTFALKQDDSDPESTAHSVLLISYIMDEEIDRSKMDADYTGLNHYTEKMIEKYRND